MTNGMSGSSKPTSLPKWAKLAVLAAVVAVLGMIGIDASGLLVGVV